MAVRLIRVSSRATGDRRTVRVYIYDTVEEMQAAGTAFNGSDHHNSEGLTQAYANRTTHKATTVIVRLHRAALSTVVVSHEMHHAATAIYGSTLGHSITVAAHLNHYNEPFAHLYSDLYASLVERIIALGY